MSPDACQPLTGNGFDRRIYEYGATDSICIYCLSTVASGSSERYLQDAEVAHDCWMRQQASKQLETVP
jgi:hypothetical protein